MKYQLDKPTDLKEYKEFFAKLLTAGATIEIKRIYPKRSLSQNSYLHLLLSAFGANFGYSDDESKTLYKREVNPHLYVYEKNGKKFLKSSADLDKDDMMISIDRFKRYSAENGFNLPDAEDKEAMIRLENYVEQNRKWL